MPSIKPAIRSKEIGSDGKSNIKIRISHDKKVRYIKTPYYIEPEFLDDKGRVKKTHAKYSSLNHALLKLQLEYEEIIAQIGPEIIFMDINTLVRKLRGNEPGGTSITKYIEDRMKVLKKENRNSYTGTYDATLKWLRKYAGKDDILFKEINKHFLEEFDAYLTIKEKKVNTRRIYMNCIRTVFNHAIDHDKVRIELFPFRKFKIRSEKPNRPALTVDEIKALQQDSKYPGQRTAVDMWMLSFSLIGMNCKDMLYLTEKNIRKGRIEYKRSKTDKKVDEKLSVKIQPLAQELMNKYKGEKYLLTFLDKNDSYSHFKTVTHNFNIRLKAAAKRLGIDEDLSMGYARHSWATTASSIGISEDTISHALGHERNRVTSGYIDYDISQVDEANEKIIKAVTSD